MCSSSTLGKSKHFIRSLPFHTPQKQWCVKYMMFTPKKSHKKCLGSMISLHSSPISWTRGNGSQTVFWGSLCSILLCDCKWLCNLEREAMSSMVRCIFSKSKKNPFKWGRSYSTLKNRKIFTSSPPQSTITTSLLGLSLPSVGFFSTFKEVNSTLYQSWPHFSCGRKQ